MLRERGCEAAKGEDGICLNHVFTPSAAFLAADGLTTFSAREDDDSLGVVGRCARLRVSTTMVLLEVCDSVG